jgi:lysophospholipase L1-like esterase
MSHSVGLRRVKRKIPSKNPGGRQVFQPGNRIVHEGQRLGGLRVAPLKKLPILGVSAGVALGLVAFQAVLASRRALILDPPVGFPEEFGDPSAPVLRLVVIGDSTAIGVGASSLEGTYPRLLARHLAKRFRVSLEVLGRSGARMSHAAHELAPQGAKLRPDISIIGIGANDVTHVTPLPRFGGDLTKAIEVLRRTGATVLVALGPRFDAPVLGQPLRLIAQARARALNRTIKKVARGSGVEILDLPMGVGTAFARDRTLYCVDGFHPSDLGYAAWADAMKDRVKHAAERLTSRRDELGQGVAHLP